MPQDMIANRYRLTAKLGSGGFGEVWQADDVELGIDVVLKRVLALYARPFMRTLTTVPSPAVAARIRRCRRRQSQDVRGNETITRSPPALPKTAPEH